MLPALLLLVFVLGPEPPEPTLHANPSGAAASTACPIRR
jgi:hypothetical protein